MFNDILRNTTHEVTPWRLRAGLIKIRTSIKPGNLTFGKALLSDQIETTTPEIQALIGKIDSMISVQQHHINSVDVNVEDVIASIDSASLQAQKALKSEWERVVKGEHAYQTTLRFAKGAIFFTVIAAIILCLIIFNK